MPRYRRRRFYRIRWMERKLKTTGDTMIMADEKSFQVLVPRLFEICHFDFKFIVSMPTNHEGGEL
jgi:hypothetical protein